MNGSTFFESQFPPSPAAVKHLSTTKLDEPGEDFISFLFSLGLRTLMPSRAATILIVLSVLIAGRAMAFDLEAHRGGRALLPENTLPAFANALSMGVDTLELDVGVTADGEVIISHERGLNPDLARDAGGAYVAAPGTPFREAAARRGQGL